MKIEIPIWIIYTEAAFVLIAIATFSIGYSINALGKYLKAKKLFWFYKIVITLKNQTWKDWTLHQFEVMANNLSLENPAFFNEVKDIFNRQSPSERDLAAKEGKG